MRAKAKSHQRDLVTETADPWTVKVSIIKDRAKTQGTIRPEGLHKLLYKRVVIESGKGRAILEQFIASARLFNRRRATPQTRIACAADANNPAAQLRHQPDTATPDLI